MNSKIMKTMGAMTDRACAPKILRQNHGQQNAEGAGATLLKMRSAIGMAEGNHSGAPEESDKIMKRPPN